MNGHSQWKFNDYKMQGRFRVRERRRVKRQKEEEERKKEGRQ